MRVPARRRPTVRTVEQDPTDLRDIERQERARSEALRRAEKQEQNDLAWLMSGPRGRRIVWRQIDRAGVLRESAYRPDSRDHAFTEGVRNPAGRLLGLVYALPEFALMVAENAPKPDTITNDQPDEGLTQ